MSDELPILVQRRTGVVVTVISFTVAAAVIVAVVLLETSPDTCQPRLESVGGHGFDTCWFHPFVLFSPTCMAVTAGLIALVSFLFARAPWARLALGLLIGIDFVLLLGTGYSLLFAPALA